LDNINVIQLFTIGYITKNSIINLNDFFNCLKYYEIKSFIDIRINPMPQHYPEYDRGHLHQFCENNNIIYHWAGTQLGNFYETNKKSRHERLIDKPLRAYADYMETTNFKIAATQIINMAKKGRLVLFSDSIYPENNFRILLSDYLLLQGIQVTHIISINEIREHLLHKNARRESMELVYDKG